MSKKISNIYIDDGGDGSARCEMSGSATLTLSLATLSHTGKKLEKRLKHGAVDRSQCAQYSLRIALDSEDTCGTQKKDAIKR